jgi:hypothetical protein
MPSNLDDGTIHDKHLLKGIYIETDNFEESLRQKLQEVSALDRVELQRQATIIHDRIVKNYSWGEQSRRIVEFLSGLVKVSPQNRCDCSKTDEP